MTFCANSEAIIRRSAHRSHVSQPGKRQTVQVASVTITDTGPVYRLVRIQILVGGDDLGYEANREAICTVSGHLEV